MTAIEIENLTKRYGSEPDAVQALDGLDLTVREGEVFGFLGPNGAGKSTTINILLHFIDATDGTATVFGHDVGEESMAVRSKTGVLPEGFEVFDRLTAREHLEWVMDAKGVEDDADAILETVGLSDAVDRQAGGFSKGMGQRLALGMALVGDPDLLILDEPSSGLDPTGMQDVRNIILDLAEQGTTVFFSSHILAEVEAVCDRVGILNQGELVALDTIEALQERDSGVETIEVTVETVPETEGIDEFDGVQRVNTDGDTVIAVCADTTAKVDVVRWLDERTTVTDIISEDTSLEELFHRYTGEDPTNEQPAKTPETPAEATGASQ
ncbi:ABC transporter ATP-binding protein [Halorhabdus sp. CBA1104]|uniref:ABC transporter ATP-binding protein n=1 Tax=unclassified Halorhabdus TaxID=2621901 RepID=UPI0012B2DD76|nr:MULTISPECIES: ABC transporter ATP-binding protein [unclassified Halorhabdus]QGN06934.1 ABC transporter ATP-binding protein [Halorhabdus sp. CBA1104]